MSEVAKVRLVRCPKCHNLLQELNDYSIYECGGCGAVLRASKMNGDLETFSEKCDEKSIGGVSEKLENLEFSEEKMNLSGGSEDDVMPIANSLRKERGVRQDLPGITSNLDGASPLEWAIEEGSKVDRNIDRLSRAKEGKAYEDLKPSDMNASGFGRSEQMPDRRFKGIGELEGFQSSQMIDIERKMYSASSCSEGGPSKNYSDIKYGESLNDSYGGSRFDKAEYTGDDRAELLKKIDELKHQLTRSVEMADKPIERDIHHGRNAHQDHYIASEDWFSDSSSGINRPFMQHRFPGNYPTQASYTNHYAEPSSYANVHAMGSRQSVFPNENPASHIQGLNDPFRSRMPMRVQHAPAPFQEQRNQGYLSGHYINSDLPQINLYEAYAPNMNYHHLSCTCLYCYKKNQVPDQLFSGIPCNRVSTHIENPAGLHLPHDYGSGVPKFPQSQSFNLQSHSRWASEVDSEVSSFVPRRPPRRHPSTGGHYCRAIAAGAPFISCNNCFELLKVPKKVMVQNGIQKKMRCGPCSSIIALDVSNKGLVVSVHESMKVSPPVAVDRQVVKLIDGNSHPQGRPNRASMTVVSSEDYDHSGYDFQSLDREVVPQTIHQPDFTKTAQEKSLDLMAASSSTSEDEATLDPMAASLKRSNTSELPMNAKSTSPASCSSLQEYLEYSNKYDRGGRFGKGNRSRRSDPESSVPDKTTSRQNSMKDASEATEIDISTNEYGNTVTSLDSGEPSKEGDQLKAKKAAFLSAFIKKSFKDSKSNQKDEQEKANVTVNGYLIPVRLIKKAEKVAGPIQPGNYWYDFRAGFWGVMGGPCHGIIPPLIEEFSHTMPENCSGGNTRVFVNGRELHQTDLSLLVGRGLPSEMNRSYIIEISGRVLDAGTGEELESLGKLAPTVERVKHGFGMKTPKATA
ncbi:hypothetical protein Leryth_004107 [Lithospermum erythrorhizon]|nr:hypothetical protein Leryth_004107 [Lithospermum erythrorhizon]